MTIWYRKFDDSWYSTRDGKAVALRDETGKKIKGKSAKDIASKAFARWIIGDRPDSSLTVGKAVDLYLTTLAGRPAERGSRFYLVSFCQAIGNVPVASLELGHATEWLASKTWKASTKAKVVSMLVACFGYVATTYPKRYGISKNPLFGLKRPRSKGRITFVSDTDSALVHKFADPAFGQFIRFLELTGCRPNEAARIVASDIRQTERGLQIVLEKHKTSDKGKSRVIYCGKEAAEILSGLSSDGPLFRSKHGRVWTQHRLVNAWRILSERIKKRSGKELPGISLYSFRHTFATKLLQRGVSIKVVADLLGNSVAVCERNYSHLELGSTLWDAIAG